MISDKNKIYMLDPLDYDMWKRHLKDRLINKGYPKQIFDDTGAQLVADNKAGIDWGITIEQAVAVICGCIDDITRWEIDLLDTPHLIIRHLDTIYETKHHLCLVSLIHSFHSCTMPDGGDVRAFISTFDHLVEQLAPFEVFNKKVLPHFFLSKLPPSWHPFVTSQDSQAGNADLDYPKIKAAAIAHGLKVNGWNISNTDSSKSESAFITKYPNTTRSTPSTKSPTSSSQPNMGYTQLSLQPFF